MLIDEVYSETSESRPHLDNPEHRKNRKGSKRGNHWLNWNL